ncbi:calpain-like cysteine peptidase [Angomonas deanei]|uniref:Calpain family cysteine protease, putative n=1 Tax=Angomonas deanei TaxID=59799 RepID=A0A7G2CAY3_9TRYP|nr:calpain-like cysteine peptidase [Angomonas deanei]CAD2215192.1 Calpain family cysteine protease, putative [Angomonas deanei]|eukprot:EPY35501.1 calpain-like cysteine peptidase [Angomonas deanei]
MNDPAEIWPCILQKAYAKLHGSYARIITGDPLHALHDMTGFSTLRFDDSFAEGSSKSENEVFEDLLKAVKGGYTIIFSTPGKASKKGEEDQLSEQYKSVGLMTGHAYTILDAKEFPDINTRIMKIRNAWGHGIEWNGDWGDNDEKWDQYPEVAQECNFQKADDGTFWMTWEDAKKYFNGGGICFSHTPAYDYRINSAFSDTIPSCVLEVDVSSPTWITFVISQEDKRVHQDEDDYEYQAVLINVAKPCDDEKWEIAVNSTVSGVRPSPDKWTFIQGRDVSLIQKFEAGKYLVVPRIIEASKSGVTPYVFGMISNKEVGADLSVRFLTIDESSRVFENFPKFDATLTPVDDVQYQKRPPGAGFPLTSVGDHIE